MTNLSSFYRWIFNNLSYVSTYTLISTLFCLAPLPLTYFWITDHLRNIHLIEHQIERLNEEGSLKTLVNQIQKHRLLSNRQQTKKLPDLNTLEAQIDQSWQIIANQQARLKQLEEQSGSVKTSMSLEEFENKWKVLKQNNSNLSPDESEAQHNVLIESLLIQLNLLGDKETPFFSTSSTIYETTRRLFMRLPFLQEDLSLLTLTSEKYLAHPTTEQRLEISNLINYIHSNINYLKTITNYYANSQEPTIPALFNAIDQYIKTNESFVNLVESKVLNENNQEINSGQLASESETAFLSGSQLWDLGLQDLKSFYSQGKDQTYFELWLVLVLTFLYLAFIFYLGLSVTHKVTNRLLDLTEATNSFTDGNLSIRISSLPYDDEVGRQGVAFNRMAQKLGELINHLYELLDATTALSNGDLTARIQVRNNQTEFDQVAQSFNQMAENFEAIIGRLQQIGIVLSNSATEIASASKEQEIIIVEQEATTREIAIAANEISSTAKEFATTMNDVNRVAEQTSGLALKGKDSLSNMETIMRQMVDASSNIAAKLAILNEKAGNITSVITTITKVADQTNLLSLNASIEAEKAGEYGRSFAVIAREIRRLADQTAISTLDIEKMVNEIMTAVSSSVMGVDDFTQEIRNGVEQVGKVSGQFTTIIEQVQAFTARFELVNQGMQAQSTGAEQINESISQLSQTAQQTSESIHQFHKTIQELNQAANELRILTPFMSHLVQNKEALISAQPRSRSIFSTEPRSKEAKEKTEIIESMHQFNQTLNNLNRATNQLKNLNIQRQSSEDKDEKEE